jgi:Tol biopolymer transport system component
VTHESWAPDGERMWFFDKNAGEWLPVSICSVARDGSDWRCHFTSYHHRLGHGRLDVTGRIFISDCQQRHDSPLLQIDAASGAHQVLCWPDSSNDGGHDACAHVHPSISPSGRFACYTSDRSGAPQVHLVPLDQR